MTNSKRFYTFPSISHHVGWLFLPVKGTDMHKVNLWGFYILGSMVRPLTKIKAGVTYDEVLNTIHMAWLTISHLDVNGFLPISVCDAERRSLCTYLLSLMKEARHYPDKQLEAVEVDDLIERVKSFESVLESELNKLNVYLVTQTEWFSTSTLVEEGENLIPSYVQEIISDYAKNEMRQAGRCIAFDLPSAAGFHIIRALEDVLRNYYDVLTKGMPRPANQSMGGLMGELNKLLEKEKVSLSDVDKIILSTLTQIKNLHRNPYIHEIVLTMKEVILLMGIAQSAIAAMGDALTEAKQQG